jgi:hypothetical protein
MSDMMIAGGVEWPSSNGVEDVGAEFRYEGLLLHEHRRIPAIRNGVTHSGEDLLTPKK